MFLLLLQTIGNFRFHFGSLYAHLRDVSHLSPCFTHGRSQVMFPGSFYALLAGGLSAAASLSAKLSLGADYVRELCESWLGSWSQTQDGTMYCAWLHVPLRLLCGGLLFVCNAVMWTFFSKALRHCSSSARATVTTTAANFISTAALGRVIFGEAHGALWWTGIFLTLCGLLMLHRSMSQTLPQDEGRKDK